MKEPNEQLPNTMAILPDGEIYDFYAAELPSGTITIRGRTYKITDSHISCVPNWDYVLSLGRLR